MSDCKQNENTTYLPAIWDDDRRMNSLFLDFRPREVNPTDYEAKLSFWKRVVIDWIHMADLTVVSMENMEQAFVRKGRTPQCLRTVVGELVRDGILLRMDDFMKLTSCSSWLSWSADILFRKPLAYAWRFFNGTGLSGDGGNWNFINMYKLKNVVESVRNKHKTLVESGLESNTLTFEMLHTHCKNIVNSEHDLQLCLLWLQKNGFVSIHLAQQQTIVKFMDTAVKLEADLDEKEKALIKLKLVKKDVENSIIKQQNNIDKYMQEVLNQIKQGSKLLAKSTLKKKKLAEKRLLEKEGVLENVDRLIYQLEEVNTHEAVLDALQNGAKAIQHDADLNINKVDDIMAAVSKAVADHQEIQEALNSTFDDGFDLSTLEDELNSILCETVEEDLMPIMKPDEPSLSRNTVYNDEGLSKGRDCRQSTEVPNLPSPPDFPVFESNSMKADAKVSIGEQ